VLFKPRVSLGKALSGEGGDAGGLDPNPQSGPQPVLSHPIAVFEAVDVFSQLAQVDISTNVMDERPVIAKERRKETLDQDSQRHGVRIKAEPEEAALERQLRAMASCAKRGANGHTVDRDGREAPL